MNVFVLDKSMVKSAEFLDDAHLTAQINEACQILTANYNHEKFPSAFVGHINHPVTKYYRDKNAKEELVSYLLYLLLEYKYRFGKLHQNFFWYYGFTSLYNFPKLEEFTYSKSYVGNMTSNINDIRYYISTKTYTKDIVWTKREKPLWWNNMSSI